jgi:hypothetical protein
MKRITLWLLATLFLANVSLAEAQQAGKIFRIGVETNRAALERRAPCRTSVAGYGE